ncbi:MAG: DUF4384 domain-containing protein [Alphaproteobacteria bacterium]|nr:DUF4384 domain-containing protein [Alphaproteobacteria bacterium]
MRSRAAVLAAVLLFALPAFAVEEEKRSAIVEAEGTVIMGDETTRAQARNAAKTQALQKALDRAGGEIRALTQVENMEFKSQQIEKESAANYRILEERDHGLDAASNTYKYWIKAEIRYSLANVSQAALKRAEAPLTVRVWTERKLYRANDRMIVQVEGNKEFYGAIFYEDAGGTLVQILPNQFRNAHQFPAKTPISVPNDQDRFELKVTPPYGTEKITVFASTCPLGRATLKAAGAGLQVADAGRNVLERQMRGIAVGAASGGGSMQGGSGSASLQPARPASAEPEAKCDKTEFYEATWEIRTQP